MMPATIMMESKRPSALRNSVGDSPVSAASMTFKSVASCIRLCLRIQQAGPLVDAPALQSGDKS